MFTYKPTEGTQETKPAQVEINGDTVYVRKKIKQVTRKTESGKVKVWEYDEAITNVKDFAANEAAIINGLSDSEALAEAADTYAEILLGQTELAIKQEEQDDTLAEILLATMG